MVRDLIEKQLPKILAVLGQIEILVQEEKKRLSLPDEVEDFEKNFRFTETSKHQFREIYRKWKIMFPTKRLDPSEFLNSQPKDIILQLEKEILINAENWNAL